MRLLVIAAVLTVCTALPGAAQAGLARLPQESELFYQTPQVPTGHEALLASDDPRLAANKRLVYDMYRSVLQGVSLTGRRVHRGTATSSIIPASARDWRACSTTSALPGPNGRSPSGWSCR